jgi:hypothetical protein
VAIEKQRTALVIPNAIWVLTADHEVRMPLGLGWIGWDWPGPPPCTLAP